MKTDNGEHPWSDSGQLFALAIFIIIWAVDSFWLKLTTLSSGIIPNVIRLAIAIAIWILAGWLMKASHHIVHAENRSTGVISTGAFRFVRHPLYLSTLLVYLGFVMLSLSLAAFVIWLVIFLFYDYIAAYEERLLVEKFGDNYRNYQHQTSRWLPKLTIG